MAEESVRTTARKRIPKKAVGRTASASRAPRQAAPAVAKKRATRTPVARKAPAIVPVAAPPERLRSHSRSRLLYVGLGLFVVLFAAGAVIGVKDSGSINVEAVIAERKAAASPEERAVIERAERSVNVAQVPDGGLVPSTDQTPPPPALPATSTATTSAESATSTATTTHEVFPTDGTLVPSDTQ